MQTLLQSHADDAGCRWPDAVAPFALAVIPLRYEGEIRDVADRLHESCNDILLFDDVDQTIGERFAESDLVGIPTKAVLGNHFRETGEVELESRDGETRSRPLASVLEEYGG